ncbi:hypothetical protein JL720_14781 [Aureococcus anophagefferens]|nr:hypothetical protein JL720_14781 [Aureococcus anophagefferens]
METVAGHVRALREGDDAAKTAAARALYTLAVMPGVAVGAEVRYSYRVMIVEAGGIPPLVDLLRAGNAEANSEAARALCELAFNNAANKVLIAEAGAIPPLVELVRDRSADAKLWAARAWASNALRRLAYYNAANQVQIAEAGGIPLLVELVRDGARTPQFRPNGPCATSPTTTTPTRSRSR